MNEDLIRKIRADFEKTGFGSEMRAARAFLARDWSVAISSMFTDLDSHSDREFDLLAEHFVTAPAFEVEDPLLVSVALCCEVKKSEKPWVLLRRPKDIVAINSVDMGALLFASEGSPVTEDQTADTLFLRTPWGRESWTAYGVHEAFKHPNAESQSYKAMTTACKAAREHFLRHVAEHLPSWKFPDQRQARDLDVMVSQLAPQSARSATGEAPSIVITRPVVILDAPLFSVELLQSSEVEIKNVEYGCAVFRFGTHEYRSKRYSVDIVTLAGLPTYLDDLCASLRSGADILSKSLTQDQHDF